MRIYEGKIPAGLNLMGALPSGLLCLNVLGKNTKLHKEKLTASVRCV
jgi:hypothetical protein